MFRYGLDEYITDFSHIFTDPSCLKSNGKSKIFDEVYSRPYQKLYLTGIDYKLYDVDGYCEDIEVKDDEEEKEYVPDNETNGEIEINYTSKKKLSLDHNDRFYVLTALKRYCERENAYKLWYAFCQDISTYKEYKTKNFINLFDKVWDTLDASKGHITVLKKYGFDVNDREIHYHLKEDEWLETVFDDIVKNCEYGINMTVAGTGVGKNQSLINLNDRWMDPLERANHKPVIVIEPLNSIIESKYDEAKFKIVTGSKHIGHIDGYEMIITNYNHLVVKNMDGSYELMENLESFFERFELVIIDESHIMLKDAFRSEVLVPFMKTLNKIKNTKVIIQTATPMFEKAVLDIKRTFIIHKAERSTKKIIFRQWNNEENSKKSILDITCLVDYYINNGKKVYIYWHNGSSQQMKMFKELYHDPDKVAIFHKRLTGEDDMSRITKEHILDDKDILISSCYFGVGNDLNDNLENVSTIIIGMLPWQEDIQAIGRWRNVGNVECCIVLDNKDMDVVKNSTNGKATFGELLDKNEWMYKQIWNDKMNRDKSVIIKGNSYMIKSEEDIRMLAAVKSAYEYSYQFSVKCDEFERRGWDVRRTIKPLVTNYEYAEKLKEWKQKRKKIHNAQIYDMVNNDEFNWDELDKDTKMARVGKIIKKLKNKELLMYADVNSVTSILRYEGYLRFYGVNMKDEYDYAELFSILWARQALKNDKEQYEEKANKIGIDTEDYIIICGYLIWWSYKNIDDNNIVSRWNYFTKFRKYVRDFVGVCDEMIIRLFAEQYSNVDFNNDKEEFFKHFFNGAWSELDTEKLKPKEQITNDGLIDVIKQLGIDENEYAKVFWNLVDFVKPETKNAECGKIGGKMGGKMGTKKVKDMETGIIYESRTECAQAIGKSNAYISKYKDRFKSVKV